VLTIKKALSYFLSFQLVFLPVMANAQTTLETASAYDLRRIMLQSEVNKFTEYTNMVYYAPTRKGKALIPVTVWGHVARPGMHHIAIGTNLITALSLGGGPYASSDFNHIRLARVENGVFKTKSLNLDHGGDIEGLKETMKPGDQIFVPQSHFFTNRAYYTSLFGIAFSFLACIYLFNEIQRGD
jgi:hypothetical protein